jgi:outer membrane biosynthesis protein TonB
VNLRAPGHTDRRSKLAGGIGTVVVHGAAVLFLVGQVGTTRAASPPVYAVNLVAAPAPTERRRIAREALPTPPQEKPAPVKPSPKPPPKAPPKPAPTPPAPTPPDREAPAPTQAPVTPAEGETPSTGTDVVTIKTPGLEFPYPEYLRNIVNQIYSRWDREDARGNRFAEISFMIRRDGSVHDIRFVTHSGSFAFDLSAQGAIEAAGNALAFGQLPDGWEADVLPVSFYFKPADQ